MAEPAADDVDFDAGLQEVYRGGMPEEMRRHMSGLWAAGIPGSGVAPYDFVDSETREGEAAPRAKDWLVRCRALLGKEPLEMSYRLIPQRTDAPLISLAMKADLRRRLELEMLDAKISDFLDPGAGVVQKEQ